MATSSNILKLVDNEEFMLTFNILSLAKNHNFFASLDKFMKEYARICLKSMPEYMSQRLESVLNKEVVISLGKDSSVMKDYIS